MPLFISNCWLLFERSWLIRICQYAQHRQFVLEQKSLIGIRSFGIPLYTRDYSFADSLPAGYFCFIYAQKLEPVVIHYWSFCLVEAGLCLSTLDKADCYCLVVFCLLNMDLMRAIVYEDTLCKRQEWLLAHLYCDMVQAKPCLVGNQICHKPYLFFIKSQFPEINLF